ncbi:MAG: hypothetical protein ACJAYV_001288 [Oleispira sp.]|jgi:hypothetical protein
MNGGGQVFAMSSAPNEVKSVMRSQPHRSNMSEGVSEQERKLIKSSWLTLSVKNLTQAEIQAKAIVEQQAGYIQNTHDEQDKSFNLSIRVPQDHYVPTLIELRKVGDIISENESVQDVTTEFIDNKARLNNLHKLRNRIQLLLNRADRIEDLLKIERELNRTQSEIDRLEGRMKYLKGQVDFASIEFSAEKQKTYGPLGYFFMGIWWGVEKLFVWDQ